ncbi:reverse transcriptase homolog [Microseira wollei NIES-4236]|uniref:Reverse transcriptase homolog n=1 Tax=Microseira wollei NIES-4236 TaxID=2530354 RepID=A0AAV3XIK4_9CYAN|nr:reverse transcriptase homolog [Microseira wollei NIES-4236]
MSKTSLKTTVEWNQVNWRKLERKVYKLQKRIYPCLSAWRSENSSQTPEDVDEVLVSKSISGS